MQLDTGEAAKLLSITPSRVRQLARSGELQAIRGPGGINVYPADAVREIARRRQLGRVWAPRTAWAAIDLIQTGTTDRLEGSQRSRLSARMRSLDAARLHAHVSSRALTRRVQVLGTTPDSLASRLQLSGLSKMTDPALLARLDLVGAPSSTIEGYAPAGGWDALRKRLGLVDTANAPDALVHLSEHRPSMGDVLTFLDLMDASDPRTRAAATRELDKLLEYTR